MASAGAASSFLVPATTAVALTLTPSACPLPKKDGAGRRRRRTAQCRASGCRGDDDDRLLWLPRREVLTGLSGVAAGFVGYPDLLALAQEAPANPAVSCPQGETVTDLRMECSPDPNSDPCPPPPKQSQMNIHEFKPAKEVTRTRKPAHILENAVKYQEAVGLMKLLDKSHPLSFDAQAAIHESYCDSHYKYKTAAAANGGGGGEKLPLDVHFSWIFAPWHRMYLYFYERALGELIHDDTFALPYWNWDAREGMGIPAIFKQAADGAEKNPLYDAYRDPEHTDALLNLDYQKKPKPPTMPFETPPASDSDARKAHDDVVRSNLCYIYTQQVRDGRNPRAYLGEKLCRELMINLGSENSAIKMGGQGTLERMAHTGVHVWTGRPTTPACSGDNGGVKGHDDKVHCENDMGFLGTAARDPLFYAHHANVDRLWHIWSTKCHGKGFDDDEWKNTSFVFYDGVKNPQLVRIKVCDVLDPPNQLGYTYDDDKSKAENLKWFNSKPTRFVSSTPMIKMRSLQAKVAPKLPLILKDKAVEVPSVAIPAKEGKKGSLVLLIDGVEYDPQKVNKFDVVINVPKEDAAKVGPKDSEYAGSFAAVPTSNPAGGKVVGKFTLFLDGVLADLGLTGRKYIDIVLVPHTDEKIEIKNLPTIELD